MTVYIPIPNEMVDAIKGAGQGFECIVTEGDSDDTKSRLLILPIKEDWQLPFLSFVKRLLDKYNAQLLEQQNKDNESNPGRSLQ